MAEEKGKMRGSLEPTPQPVPMFYSNAVRVSHQPFQFEMDFAMTISGTDQAQLLARAVLSPQHMKALMKAIAENIKNYETSFGKINFPETGPGIDEILGQFEG
jgi:hypothetical protein